MPRGPRGPRPLAPGRARHAARPGREALLRSPDAPRAGEVPSRRAALLAMAQTHGRPLEVAAVVGDDVMERLGELNAAGVTLDHMDDGRAFSDVRARVSSANAYFGAWPVVEALASGAQVVVTGRCTDTGITLAPMI